MTLAPLFAGSPSGDPVKQDDIIFNDRRFPDHDAHPMIDKDPLADLRTRMNLDPRQETPKLGRQFCQKIPAMMKQKMRPTMPKQGMKSWVCDDDLQR